MSDAGRMTARSHVEPALGVVFLHVPQSLVTQELLRTVDQGASVDDVNSAVLFEALPPRSQQILFHEHYHFWQGLRLPFLHRYAFLSQHVVWSTFKALAQHEANWRIWDCEVPALHRLDRKDRIRFRDAVMEFEADVSPSGHHSDNELFLSPIDLLECAAALAEYQYCVSKLDLDDEVAFRRWANRNPGYFAPLDLLSRFIDDRKLALRLCLPLINACFETTEPVRSFAELAARVWGMTRRDDGKAFIAQPEPCKWVELFAMLLDDIRFDVPADTGGEILDAPYMRLTLANWTDARFGGSSQGTGVGHLILSAPAKAWNAAENSYPLLRTVMSQPRVVGAEILNGLQDKFTPPLTVVTIHAGDRPRTVLASNRSFRNVETPSGMPAQSFKGMVADVLTMYSAVRRATGAHFSADQRTCGHHSCPLFELNYCNSYPIVPTNFEDCGFAVRMDRLVKTLRR